MSEHSETTPEPAQNYISHLLAELFYSPVNLILMAVISILVYKIIKAKIDIPQNQKMPEEHKLPKLRKDFTVEELKKYDGTQEDGRILVAVNGSVYDVTKGRRFYGPGGPYAAFGGRDASRGLATFSVSPNESNEYDDLSDLSTVEMDSVREWEMQFKEKYDLVGKLLKPGELPASYSDEEEEDVEKSEKGDQQLKRRNINGDMKNK